MFLSLISLALTRYSKLGGGDVPTNALTIDDNSSVLVADNGILELTKD